MHMVSDCVARNCDQTDPVADLFVTARSVTDGNRPGLQLYRRYARFAGIGAAAFGGAALLEWIAGAPVLAAINPASATMKVNTAIAFFAAGIGLFLAVPDGGNRRARAVGVRICAGFVAAIGFAAWAEYAFGWPIAESAGTIGTMIPGRMAPLTSGSFEL